MRSYFNIESPPQLDPVTDICRKLAAALKDASRVEIYGGGSSENQTRIAVISKSGNVISREMVRSKVAQCGFTFIEGSYDYDPF